MRSRRARAQVLVASVLLVLVACTDGDDDDEASSPTTATTRVNLLDFTTTTSPASTETTAAATTTTAAPSTTVASTTTTSRPTTTTARQPSTVTVGRAQNGQTVRLVKGDKLQVVLEECSSCGDQWRVTGIPNQTVFGPVTTNHDPGDGTTGRAVFETTANASGTTGIEIGFFRSGQTAAAERFALTLTVAR